LLPPLQNNTQRAQASERARAAHLSHSLRPFCYIPRLLPSFFLLAGALNFENYGSISFHFPKQYLSSLLILLSEFQQCKIESTRLFASEWREKGLLRMQPLFNYEPFPINKKLAFFSIREKRDRAAILLSEYIAM
jgi:hypothetical protein